MKNFFFLILGLIVIFGSIFLFFRQSLVIESRVKVIKINDTSVKVEIADTPETRAKGLSGRETLPTDTGMLFVFGSSEQYGFWMKDMNFAIDIVWIDEKFYIIGIEKGVLPETFPQVFYPEQTVKYVLELPAGFTDKYRIDIGAMVQWFDELVR
ncbi:MAG: DUF192 domain-containing protein [Patescibacteria group bacterium]|nr:DUF192 domain-containing protein [Patescibacteria group bacterium]